MTTLAGLRKVSDPIERAKRAIAELEAMTELVEVRDQAIRAAVMAGMSMGRVSSELGISKQRISQICAGHSGHG